MKRIRSSRCCSFSAGPHSRKRNGYWQKKAAAALTGWKLFSDLVIRHGVAALVWQNITDLGLTEAVPEPERGLLENIRFKTIARVSYITSEAAEVVAELEKEGIRALLLKGLALEHSVYGSRGLRQMSDADLLVAPEDALRAQGYTHKGRLHFKANEIVIVQAYHS